MTDSTSIASNNNNNNRSSSLQRAAAAAASDETPRATFETANGAFENCFAAGLDLSEFSTTSRGNGGGDTSSAASELLRVKETERLQRQEAEAEEQKMKQVLQKKLQALQKRPNESSNAVVDALVRMHGTEEALSSSRGMNRKKALHKKAGVRSVAVRQQQTSSKKRHHVSVKKSRKIKY
eukprot:CAMPEP_0178736770 /NCGR_PEP_ID=MMETSP0744-20121128/2619_1 /TAXON_ID=913974 /ORGANISM="Nitzschia punctata, Strain CCMP561" /LENGTH=179 /DNA_ID=CAMNT_0020389269 /DNA_START=16 /DNA_END=555 /DNA_ORIENTATION=+